MNNLIKKLKGYQKAPRERFLLLKEGMLTQEEFLIYEFAIAITDWDSRHETYGTFKATNQEIADYLGWKSDTSVSRHKNHLITKGILTKAADGGLKVKNFEKWQRGGENAADTESLDGNKQLYSAKSEDKNAETKENRVQSGVYPLVSSKVDLSVFKEASDEFMSEGELDEIASILDSRQTASTSAQQDRWRGASGY